MGRVRSSSEPLASKAPIDFHPIFAFTAAMEFSDLVARGEVALSEAIELGVQESLQLDFKAQGEEDALFADGRLTKRGKAAIGKALSAFSNSAGGLIVIGVICKPIDGVDAASELDPIPNWKRALSDVSSAVGDLLQPKNDGINVQGFPSSAADADGYLVIDVPRSERRPHRCEASGAKQYFKRSGSGSYTMEHYDIEDAFRRFGSPDLSLQHELRRSSRSANSKGVEAAVSITLAVANSGAATAKHVCLEIIERQGIKTKLGALYIPTTNKSVQFGGRPVLVGSADFVVNPGETRVFDHLGFVARRENDGRAAIGDYQISQAQFRMRYVLTAENMRPKSGELSLTQSDFASVMEFLDG